MTMSVMYCYQFNNILERARDTHISVFIIKLFIAIDSQVIKLKHMMEYNYYLSLTTHHHYYYIHLLLVRLIIIVNVKKCTCE